MSLGGEGGSPQEEGTARAKALRQGRAVPKAHSALHGLPPTPLAFPPPSCPLTGVCSGCSSQVSLLIGQTWSFLRAFALAVSPSPTHTWNSLPPHTSTT